VAEVCPGGHAAGDAPARTAGVAPLAGRPLVGGVARPAHA
jgi:hypothetical protein